MAAPETALIFGAGSKRGALDAFAPGLGGAACQEPRTPRRGRGGQGVEEGGGGERGPPALLALF